MLLHSLLSLITELGSFEGEGYKSTFSSFWFYKKKSLVTQKISLQFNAILSTHFFCQWMSCNMSNVQLQYLDSIRGGGGGGGVGIYENIVSFAPLKSAHARAVLTLWTRATETACLGNKLRYFQNNNTNKAGGTCILFSILFFYNIPKFEKKIGRVIASESPSKTNLWVHFSSYCSIRVHVCKNIGTFGVARSSLWKIIIHHQNGLQTWGFQHSARKIIPYNI